MAISPEQQARVQAIIERLDERLRHPEKDNRRASRVAARFALRVILLTGLKPVPVDVFSRNISASGIAFVSRRLFQAEERVAISLQIPNLPSKLILARITFGRYVQGSLYEVGAEFLESIADPRNYARVPLHWIMSATGRNKTGTETEESAPAAKETTAASATAKEGAAESKEVAAEVAAKAAAKDENSEAENPAAADAKPAKAPAGESKKARTSKPEPAATAS